ncbi:MAG: type 3 dihydrofolate reductase [Ottowia sp.]|nr:type 3 dihydrofolate reductase [Ottowia sp.]
MSRITLIVAYAHNRVIGKNNQMPWHLPEDLAHFKRTTLGAPVIMGRKTWEAIGRPLPGRKNIVISRNAAQHVVGAQLAISLEDALTHTVNVPEVFVIGGAQIYEQAMPHAQRLIVTEIDRDIEGDAFFPEIDLEQWHMLSRNQHQAAAPNNFSFAIVEYQRNL